MYIFRYFRLNLRSCIWFFVITVAIIFGIQLCNAQAAGTPITVTVKQGARQTFAGLGVSQTLSKKPAYSELSQSEKDLLNKLVWNEANFKILRLWFNTNKYAPQPSKQDSSQFVKSFIESGIISDAIANGCKTLLLGPGGIPKYMGPNKGGYIFDSQIKNYAALLANFIFNLKKEYGVTIHATGVLNEPNDRFIRLSKTQWPIMIKTLRKELDNRGLNNVKIIAPELANADSHAVKFIKKIKEDSKAWESLAGISTHSYNMAAIKPISDLIEGTNKEYWQTEAGANGREAPGNALNAASAASRFLNDMNQRVTHWIWFIGYLQADAKDDATRLIRYWSNPFRYDIFQKYYYLKQLSQAFDVGAVFRKSISSLEGEMKWTYGKKPRITVASAENPDGSWGIALSNYTSNRFIAPYVSKWTRTQKGHKAQTFKVTVFVEELAQAGDISMKVYRSNSNVNNVYTGNIVMHNGKVTVSKVKSLDLITLRGK
ncbi:MAG: hypothetical protein KI793_10800 [Rivularia sp. (in: Bacteria)]|nr:hypothetical protein [Rivularia sp. MS3]